MQSENKRFSLPEKKKKKEFCLKEKCYAASPNSKEIKFCFRNFFLKMCFLGVEWRGLVGQFQVL